MGGVEELTTLKFFYYEWLINYMKQVMITLFSGLMDKKSNFFTHFCGIFLRPKGFLENLEAEPVSNGH